MHGTSDNLAVTHAAQADAAACAEPSMQRQHALAQGLTHDLRTPLRAIDGFAALLNQQTGLDDAGRGHLQRIRDAVARMGHLLDALQEYTAAEHAAYKREDVDLSLLADWIGAELQDAAPGRAAVIEVDPGLTVQGDEHYLKRMLTQLLDNAWKFSAPRERVEIRVEGERVGDALHLRVRDAGIGFDMQYAARLFAPFQRLHGPDEGAGAGLGLAIAQCIARRHGGRIRAESTPGQGSVFHVELPLAQPQEESADGHAQGQADG